MLLGSPEEIRAKAKQQLLEQDLTVTEEIIQRTACNIANFKTAIPTILAMGVGLANYEVYQILKIWREEGPTAALEKVAVDGTIMIVTAGAGKVAYDIAKLSAPMAEMVWMAYLAQNPVFAQVASKVFAPLGKGLSKAKGLYQKADAALESGANKLYHRVFGNKASSQTIEGLDLAETANSSIYWVDEKVTMSSEARLFNDSVMGARTNTYSQLSQAPSLKYTGKNGKPCVVRFDGIEDNVLIDRKIAIVTTDKAKNQALRQAEALTQNSLKGKWEVPSQRQQFRAEKMLEELKITNIRVEVVNVSNTY